MENFFLGLMALVFAVILSALISLVWITVLPTIATSDDRVRFRVLCENRGGEVEGSFCVIDNKIVRVNLTHDHGDE